MGAPEYAPKVIDHFTSPRNVGSLPEATGCGLAGDGVDGSLRIEVSVRATAGWIHEARFRAFGCSAAIAAASVTTELLTGATLDDAQRLTAKAIEAALGGLPPDKRYCADYAALAASRAVTAAAAAEEGL